MIFLNSFVIIILRQIKKKTYLINQMKVRNDSIDTCEKHFGLMAWVDDLLRTKVKILAILRLTRNIFELLTRELFFYG